MKIILRNNYKWGDLLYEFLAENRLTVYRRLDIPNRDEFGWVGHPRTSMNFVIAFVFLVNFYIMVTSFVLLTFKISYWSFIFCDFQLPSSVKRWLLTATFDFQNVEKWWKFRKFQKISGNSFSFWNSELSNFPWKKIDDEIPMLVLLYEFPAETRLTVYRRLDMTRRVGVFFLLEEYYGNNDS